MNSQRQYLTSSLFVSVCFGFLTTTLVTSFALAAGIVDSIVKAPVVADGDVTGKPTDYVINLSGSMDPNVAGRSLSEGGQIRVIFPPDFDLTNLNPMYPLLDAPTPLPPIAPLQANDCVPAWLTCTTAVILQGWPQNPYFPPAIFHTMSIDPNENTLIFTAKKDMLANPPAAPGIKQLHLILNGVTNPAPGNYMIRVEAQTGPGGSWETGSALLQVLSNPRPSVNITSVFVKATAGIDGPPACGPGNNPPNPWNPIYQSTSAGSAAPYPWTVLLWGDNAEALTDIQLVWVNPDHARVVRGNKTIGHVYIDSPKGASGHGIIVNPLSCDTSMGGAPVIGATDGIGPQPVGRLDMVFVAGDTPGKYRATISLNNGNSVAFFVTAD
jgi:hypothetical protein